MSPGTPRVCSSMWIRLLILASPTGSGSGWGITPRGTLISWSTPRIGGHDAIGRLAYNCAVKGSPIARMSCLTGRGSRIMQSVYRAVNARTPGTKVDFGAGRIADG